MPLRKLGVLTLCIASLWWLATDVQASQKRALIIGIDDYSASHLPPQGPPAPERGWPNLGGAVNDAESMRTMLTLLNGFARADVLVLTDQAATRRAILDAIERQLVAPTATGDIVFFYYAGHGSQVRNTRSDEPDQLDESIVPADSRVGAPDIRDKELRRLFNRILDRGAHLTVMIDACHSGSGARGLPAGGVVSGVKPDRRDVADGTPAGPRPEDRGSLVLSASQDFEDAREKLDPDRKIRGAFTWAWMRAMRDASPNEPALDTFLRAQARLRIEMPYQEPVIAGNASARRLPFLGTREEPRAERTKIAVGKVADDGTALLQGGWANGLSIGSPLRSPSDPATRITVTKLIGLGQSEVRVEHGRITTGMLLESAGWVAQPARPLRVWMPFVTTSELPIRGLARVLEIIASKRRIRWVSDPTVSSPEYVLRRRERNWELLAPGGSSRLFGADDAGAEAAIDAIGRGSSVFVQLPAFTAFAEQLALPRSEIAADPNDADYVLAGRYVRGKLAFAWVRPGVIRADRRKCALPIRTAWSSDGSSLRDAAFRLRKIAAWLSCESPSESRSPYHLALRRDRDGAPVRSGALGGREIYRFELMGRNLPPRVDGRFVYVFVIDSGGRSTLLYPRPSGGSVENRFPLDPSIHPPEEIPLGKFQIGAPFGVDTYFLLTTDQALPDPSILEWNGVRQSRARKLTALQELLAQTGYQTRSVVTQSNWSIERTTWESTPQRKRGRV